MAVGASVSKSRMTNFGSAQIQSAMLFGQRRLLLSCYSGSALRNLNRLAIGLICLLPNAGLQCPTFYASQIFRF